MANKFKVKIPTGYLMVEEKGSECEYPGIYISFSKDGTEDGVNNLVTCIEYDSCTNDIKTVTYEKDVDEPNNIICYKTAEI